MGRPIFTQGFYSALAKDTEALAAFQTELDSLVVATNSISNDKVDVRLDMDDDEEDGPLIEERILDPQSARALAQVRRASFPAHLSPISLDLLVALPPTIFPSATQYEESRIGRKVTIRVFRDLTLLGTIEGDFQSISDARRHQPLDPRMATRVLNPLPLASPLARNQSTTVGVNVRINMSVNGRAEQEILPPLLDEEEKDEETELEQMRAILNRGSTAALITRALEAGLDRSLGVVSANSNLSIAEMLRTLEDRRT